VRTRLIQQFALGMMPRIPDAGEARKLAETTRLLRRRELQEIFPDATIEDERLLGMTKSITAVKW
jgi:hypothetical protein